MAAITEAAERKILEGATARRADVARELAQLAPRAIAEQSAGDAYQRLTLERGQLETVIAAAQSRLDRPARDGTV